MSKKIPIKVADDKGEVVVKNGNKEAKNNNKEGSFFSDLENDRVWLAIFSAAVEGRSAVVCSDGECYSESLVVESAEDIADKGVEAFKKRFCKDKGKVFLKELEEKIL